MNFNDHSKIEGCHAILSPSGSTWLRYNDDNLINFYDNGKAKKEGTELHALAADLIKRRLKLSNSKKTLNRYVNDAIGFRMSPEVVLYYSPLCFGTTDAIYYKDGFLRIHDLKTGKHPASFDQLLVYAALFYLEYHIRPEKCQTELRIYQNDEVRIEEPDPEVIAETMDIIVHADSVLSNHISLEG